MLCQHFHSKSHSRGRVSETLWQTLLIRVCAESVAESSLSQSLSLRVCDKARAESVAESLRKVSLTLQILSPTSST